MTTLDPQDLQSLINLLLDVPLPARQTGPVREKLERMLHEAMNAPLTGEPSLDAARAVQTAKAAAEYSAPGRKATKK